MDARQVKLLAIQCQWIDWHNHIESWIAVEYVVCTEHPQEAASCLEHHHERDELLAYVEGERKLAVDGSERIAASGCRVAYVRRLVSEPRTWMILDGVDFRLINRHDGDAGGACCCAQFAQREQIMNPLSHCLVH